jgi:hypothetical protein
LLQAKPFEPFEVHLSSGDVYLVHHLEQVALGKARMVIVCPEADDRFVLCALVQIASITSAPSAA